MLSSTLWPGSSPPSPGFAPCEILICSSSALVRYQIVTPKRPEATCLIAERLRVAVGQRLEPLGVFAAFARVALAADAVHGDGQRLVGLGRDRAEAHRAGAEPLDDLLGRLDFVERNRAAVRAGLNFKQAAQCAARARVVVGVLGEPLVGVAAVVAGGHLQVGDRRRIPHVPLAVGPPVELAGVGQHGEPIGRRARDSRARAGAALPRPSTSKSTPWMRLAVPAKQRSITSSFRPTASKICAPL